LPRKDTVIRVARVRVPQAAAGSNPGTKAVPKDTADQAQAVKKAGLQEGRQPGEGQVEGRLPRRGAAYFLEQPGAAPTECPLVAPCQHPMLRGRQKS